MIGSRFIGPRSATRSIDVEERVRAQQRLAERRQGPLRRSRLRAASPPGRASAAGTAARLLGQEAPRASTCAGVGPRPEGQPPGQAQPVGGSAPASAATRVGEAPRTASTTNVVVHQQQRLRRDRRDVPRARSWAPASGRRTPRAGRAAGCAGPGRTGCGGTPRRRASPSFAARPAGRVAGVSTPTITWPVSSGATGTGGPNIVGLRPPEAARIASRTASASSRRTDIRPSRRLSGSAGVEAGSGATTGGRPSRSRSAGAAA